MRVRAPARRALAAAHPRVPRRPPEGPGPGGRDPHAAGQVEPDVVAAVPRAFAANARARGRRTADGSLVRAPARAALAEALEEVDGAEPAAAPPAAELARRLRVPLREVRALLETPRIAASLEQPVRDEDETELGALIPGRSAGPPDRAVAQRELGARVAAALATRPEREREPLTLRFGLGTDQGHTLEAVGRRWGLTRDRVRQLEVRALRRRRERLAGLDLRTLLAAE